MSSSQSKPIISRFRGLPLVWIVPLLALVISGWMVIGELAQRGPEVTVTFSDAAGVEVGRTKLEHKGVTVGEVSAVEITDDLQHVLIKVRLDRRASALAAEGSQFWIVHPKIGFSGVSGLDTLVSGVRLNVRPGDGPTAHTFEGLDQAPPPKAEQAGRAFELESTALGAITPGAPIYYREIKVGQVETSWLSKDATRVLARIRIESAYVDLVRTNSVFWNAGGLSMKVGLLGAELKSSSVESLFSGGVAFATPEPKAGASLAAVAPAGHRFKLADEAEDAWKEWSPVIPITSPQASPDSNPDSPLEQMMSGGEG
ncbi:intermembrane transport protein PqiB [Synoicihabitans lomoniglobus]|uniref:MlaD family protein n=1 Tax=Synoicihabitans lomoniglobus TaxID=2909285 RepID=A0AAF0A154_9BACT|nr:MlaD family protein [Opitutaceae bacterium LMO-M01]WED65473.1 MlaD family protein [Opitutaceae bacterium LMO-M01]